MIGQGTSLRRFWRCAWLGIFCLPVLLCAQSVFLGIDSTNTFYRLDPASASATIVGNAGLGFEVVEGLAISPFGMVFGTGSSGNLYSFDPATGAATFVGSTGRGSIEALEFVGNSLVAFSASSPSTFFSIDMTSGATTDLFTSSFLLGGSPSPGVPRAMAALDATTMFVMLSGPAPNFYSVNLSTGAATLVGSMPGMSSVLAMDFHSDGLLYGFDSNGSVWRINFVTAATTFVGNTGGQSWRDATALAIPEPSTWALLVVGAGLVVARARQSRRHAYRVFLASLRRA